jgi:drug/metabolite transporter (DMT)-like permease
LRFFTPLALTALRLAVSAASVWAYALNASLAFTTPAHASPGVSTMPIFAAVAARLVLRERLSARRLGAILLAFVGAALVIASGRGVAVARNAVLGDLLALATAAS